MRKKSTLFLKLIVLLIGITTLVALIWMPQTEGRNVDKDILSIYSEDPFLWYIYLASTPFFFALYQVLKLLGLVEKNKVFSNDAIKAIKNIKYCALLEIGLIGITEILIALNGEEDKAGPMALGFYMSFVSIVIIAAAAVFQRILENGTNIKSENDLTI